MCMYFEGYIGKMDLILLSDLSGGIKYYLIYISTDLSELYESRTDYINIDKFKIGLAIFHVIKIINNNKKMKQNNKFNLKKHISYCFI